MLEPDQQPADTDAAQPRRGCSCFGIICLLIATVVALAVTAMLLAEQYVRQQAYKGSSAAEIAEFEKWLHEPVHFPAEWYEDLPPIPKHIQEQRAQYFQKADTLRGKLDHVFYPQTTATALSEKRQVTPASPPSIYEKLVNAEPLNGDEQASVATLIKTIEPVAGTAMELTRHEGYRLNNRGLFDNQVSFWTAGSADQLSLYALALSQAGEHHKALEALNATSELNRRDPGFVIHYLVGDIYRRTCQGISRYTTSTAQLKELLEVVVSSRSSMLPEPGYLYHPISGYHKIGMAMHEDGFLHDEPRSRHDYLQTWLLLPDYIRWLKHQPPTHPRSSAGHQATLSQDYSYFLPFYAELEPFSVGLLKPIVRHLNVSLATPGLMAMYHDNRQFQERVKLSQAQYDLFCLHLSRRIALLEGKPQPVSPGDFAPHYLPAFPTDPFTSAPMQLDTSKDRFYSVGPDETAGTADDVIDITDTYEQVDRATNRRR